MKAFKVVAARHLVLCTYPVLRFMALLAGAAGMIPAPAFASPGDLFVSNSINQPNGDSILRFTPDGTRSTFATGLSTARGVAFDKAGNLFVANGQVGQILKYDRSGNMTIFASGEGSNDVTGLAFDSDGDLFVTKYPSGSILKFSPDGTRSVFASGVNFPAGLAFDRNGNLFVAEQLVTDDILKIAPDGTKTVFASNLSDPTGLAFDDSGNLFVADQSDGQIVEFTPTAQRSTFAHVVQPLGLTFDSFGNLLVADNNKNFSFNNGGFIYSFTPEGARSTYASGVNADFMAFAPSVPEPTTATLLLLGMLGCGWRRRR